MEFREIDTFEYVNEKVPFAIRSIFKWDFEDGKMYQRFIKLNDSFALYLDWMYFKQEMIEGKVFDENGELFTNESIEPYLKSYSTGFVKGYHDLDKEIKETTSIFQVTNDNVVNKIFSILNVGAYAFSTRRYLNEPAMNAIEKPIITHKDLENDAQAVGRYYKAWFFVMNNPDLFIERFKAFYIEDYKLIEAELRERNKHHTGYKTELQDIIDENEVNPKGKPLPTIIPAHKIPFTKLEDAVIHPNALNEIYELLISEDLIEKETYIHKDRNKGYQGYFYSTLEGFYTKGYFKRELQKHEYLDICLNTFKLKISESTARNKKTRPKGLDKIPVFPPNP